MARNNIPTEKSKYIEATFVQEPESLRAIRESIAGTDEATIQISPSEGKLLYILLKMIGAKRVLEIGSLVGYSAAWIASALPADGKLYAVEKDLLRAKQVEHNLTQAGLANKVEVRCGDAKEVLRQFAKESLDAIFIDGNKADYPLYLELSYELLRPRGLIIADNTLLFGHIYRDDGPTGKMGKLYRAMREFNLKAAAERFESIMLPTEEGMVVAIKAA